MKKFETVKEIVEGEGTQETCQSLLPHSFAHISVVIVRVVVVNGAQTVDPHEIVCLCLALQTKNDRPPRRGSLSVRLPCRRAGARTEGARRSCRLQGAAMGEVGSGRTGADRENASRWWRRRLNRLWRGTPLARQPVLDAGHRVAHRARVCGVEDRAREDGHRGPL